MGRGCRRGRGGGGGCLGVGVELLMLLPTGIEIVVVG